MRLSLVSHLLLVLMSVLTLTRAQTSTDAPTSDTTTETTTDTTTDTTEPTTDTTEATTDTTTDTTEPTTDTTEATTDTTTDTTEATTDTTTEPTTDTTEATTDTTTEATTDTTTEATTEETTETTITPAIETTTILTDIAITTAWTDILTTTAWTAPAIFYPFGSAAGDTEQLENGGETYFSVDLSTPFLFFGRTYSRIYVNNNGLLSFSQPLPEAHPYPFPTYGSEDFIAPLWTELDDFGLGRYSYQQYTSGNVLTRATQDIKQYFPQIGFSASWVFVVTWDYVQTYNIDVLNLHSAPAITFQVVLISGGGFSFILMNYGDCDVISYPVEAGYDTINSTDYHVIHYGNDGSYIPNLKDTSNINVPGRWAFLVNNGTETVVGVQMKLQSFLNLAQSENMEAVLQKIKQELVNHGVSSFIEIKLRNIKEIKP